MPEQVEFDFMRSSVCREHPRTRTMYIDVPVISTSWLDVNEEDIKRSMYRSR